MNSFRPLIPIFISTLILLSSCVQDNIHIEYGQKKSEQSGLKIPDRLSFTDYTVNDGLPENSAFSLQEDQYGNLWVSTQNGIARFQDNKLIPYTYSEIDSNTIYPEFNWIKLMKDGSLIAFSSKGVALYNEEKDLFERILDLKDVEVIDVWHDEDYQVDYDEYGYWFQRKHDSLYVCLSNDKEYSYNLTGTVLKKRNLGATIIVKSKTEKESFLYEIKGTDLAREELLVAQSISGDLDFVVTNKNDYYYIFQDSLFHSTTGFIASIECDSSNPEYSMYFNETSQELTVVSSSNSSTNIFQFRNDNLITDNLALDGDFIIAEYVNDSDLIVFTANEKDQENLVFKIGNSISSKVLTNFNELYGGFSAEIRDINIDNSGHLFIGTWGHGLVYSNLTTTGAFKYHLDLDDRTIVPYYVDHDTLYAVTLNGRFIKLDLSSGKHTIQQELPEGSFIISYKQFGDMIYMAAAERGVYLFDTKTKEISHIDINNYIDDGVLIASNVLLDSKQNLWITSSASYSDYGLAKFSNNEIRVYEANDTGAIFKDKRVMDVFEFKNEVFITDQVYGLYKYNEQYDNFTGYEEGDIVQCSRLVTIVMNDVWSSSFTNGMVKVDLPEHKNLVSYSRENEKLPISWIDNYLFVNDTTLLLKGETPQWYEFNCNTESVKLIPDYNETYWFYHCTPINYKNSLWVLPGKNGLVLYDFESKTNKSSNSLFLQNLNLNNESIYVDRINDLKGICVSYNQNDISLKLSTKRPQKEGTKYYFRLKGYQENWKLFDTKEYLSLNNINHGAYHLEIELRDVNSTPINRFILLNITVNKPWWQTIWFYSLIAVLIIIMVISIIRIRTHQLRKKQKLLELQIAIATKELTKQKTEIENAHEELEEKHQEITDSINYAERIQRSFLATKEILDANLKDYFVFFIPKEAVSGDFYWAAELKDGDFAWSVADSTGHGVPGAIMSLLNISSLEKSIETETSPDKILVKTREIIINRLKKDGSAEGGKDGMDCNLLVINKERDTLTFASAHNPVIIIRDGEIIEFKGDKIPVGKHDWDQEPFTLNTLQLQKGDVIYALTDGFPDQFGGPKGKKYMIKNLKNKFLEIAQLPMSEQKEILYNEFENWKTNNEQIDDVCIIGVRI